MRDRLPQRRDLGVALIIITHNLGVVARYADRVNVMYAGKIIESGSAADIYKHNPWLKQYLKDTPKPAAEKTPCARATSSKNVTDSPFCISDSDSEGGKASTEAQQTPEPSATEAAAGGIAIREDTGEMRGAAPLCPDLTRGSSVSRRMREDV